MKSKQAAGAAVKLGYTKVYWYRDGIKGWKKAGNTLKVKLPFLNEKCKSGIDPKALKKLLSTDKNAILVDIRDEPSKKKFGRIGAFTIDYPIYRLNKLMSELPKHKSMVLYDIRGKQAPIATRYLKHFIFQPERVRYLKGGIESWQKAGFDVVKEK